VTESEHTNADNRGDIDLTGLYEELAPELRAFFRLKIGPRISERESAEDLVQTVFREVIQDIDQFEDRGEDSFRKWLFMTAWRKLRDRQRFWGRECRNAQAEVQGYELQQASFYGHILSPSRIAMGREEAEKFERAFDALPEDHRTVITFSRMLGLSTDEIATEMDRSEGAVRVLLHRALARLGRILEEGA